MAMCQVYWHPMTDRRYTDTKARVAELIDQGLDVLKFGKSTQVIYRHLKELDIPAPAKRDEVSA